MSGLLSNSRPQQTLAKTARVSGFGYWSSEDVTVEFRPAAPGTGVVFVRGDQPGQPRIAARVGNRLDVPRRTNLACGGAQVEMVEHVMAALAGLRIDNCEVWCDASEMPGPDGSSRRFVDALLTAGVTPQDAVRRQLTVTDTIRVEADKAWVMVEPCDRLEIGYSLDYGDGPIGRQQFAAAVDQETFLRELADARTFILAEEAAWLQSRGMGLRATHADLLVIGPDGPLDNQLRFQDECARHKALDMIGDLSLTDCDLIGKFTASRSGHKLNAQLLELLLRADGAARRVA